METLFNINFAVTISSLLLENLKIQQQHQHKHLIAKMSRTIWCRLCVNSCKDYQSLYDENGHRNVELYEMTAKYFHPIFLTIAKGNQLTVMCLECWHQISEFHHFQNSIIAAQSELLDKQVEPVDADSEVADDLIEAISITNREVDMDDKNVIMPLPQLEIVNVHDDLTTVNASVDERSKTESKYKIKTVIVTRASDKEGLTEEVASQNDEIIEQIANEHEDGISSDEQFNDNDNMEFSQSDLALIDSMEYKIGDLLSLQKSNFANKTNDDKFAKIQHYFPETRASKVKRLDDIIAQCGQTLVCPLCNVPITSYGALRGHFKKTHCDRDCYIICCQRKLKTRYHIEEHLRLHLDPSGYTCEICATSFTAKGALKRHMIHQHLAPKAAKQSKSKKKQYAKSVKDLDAIIARWKPNLQCVLCNASHKNFEVLRRHFHLEHPMEQCYILCCQRKLETRWQIVEHARFHMDPKSFKCKYCDKRQPSRKQLRDHMYEEHSMAGSAKNAQAKRRSHKCSICDKVFKSSDYLQEHMITHREMMVVDGATSNSSHHLSDQETKEDEAIIEQELYNLTEDGDISQTDVSLSVKTEETNTNGNDNKIVMDKHITDLLSKETKESKIKHLDDLIAEWGQTLECPVCHEAITNYSTLREHFEKNHFGYPSYIVCCQHKLSTRFHIEEHLRLHLDPNGFKCDVCETTFSARSSYRRHILRKHANSEHKCSICGNVFKSSNNLQEHMTTHTDKDQDVATISSHLQTKEHNEPPNDRELNNQSENDVNFSQSVLDLIKSTDATITNESDSNNERETLTKETRESKIKGVDNLIDEWGQTLRCPLCHETVTNYSTLRQHFQKNHRGNACYFLCCQHKLCTIFSIEEHIRLHLHPKGFKCDICETTFSARSSYRRHLLHKHANAAEVSKSPKGKQPTKPKRKQYRKNVKDLDEIIRRWKPNLQCVLCSASHPNFEVLRRHFHLEHPMEQCYILCCQRKLETRWRIVEHARFHMDPKSFKCKYCDKRQPSRKQLHDHMYEHHAIAVGARKVLATKDNHKCNICDSNEFKSSDDLQAHMACHAGLDLYKCLHCPQSMKYRYNLYPHLRNVHPKAWSEKKNVKKHFELITIQKDGLCIPDIGTEGT